MPSAARITGSGTERIDSTRLRTRMTSVYSAIATTIGLSFVSPSHGEQDHEQRERGIGVDDVRDGEQHRVDAPDGARPGTPAGTASTSPRPTASTV